MVNNSDTIDYKSLAKEVVLKHWNQTPAQIHLLGMKKSKYKADNNILKKDIQDFIEDELKRRLDAAKRKYNL